MVDIKAKLKDLVDIKLDNSDELKTENGMRVAIQYLINKTMELEVRLTKLEK